jgi:hypothetical protein
VHAGERGSERDIAEITAQIGAETSRITTGCSFWPRLAETKIDIVRERGRVSSEIDSKESNRDTGSDVHDFWVYEEESWGSREIGARVLGVIRVEREKREEAVEDIVYVQQEREYYCIDDDADVFERR